MLQLGGGQDGVVAHIGQSHGRTDSSMISTDSLVALMFSDREVGNLQVHHAVGDGFSMLQIADDVFSDENGASANVLGNASKKFANPKTTNAPTAQATGSASASGTNRPGGSSKNPFMWLVNKILFGTWLVYDFLKKSFRRRRAS